MSNKVCCSREYNPDRKYGINFPWNKLHRTNCFFFYFFSFSRPIRINMHLAHKWCEQIGFLSFSLKLTLSFSLCVCVVLHFHTKHRFFRQFYRCSMLQHKYLTSAIRSIWFACLVERLVRKCNQKPWSKFVSLSFLQQDQHRSMCLW